MKTFSVVALLAAVPLGAFGLSITSPGTLDKWESSGSRTITWKSVSSDPSSFSIHLTNFGVYPPQVLTLADNQLTSAGTFTFSSILPVGDNYRIRFNALVTPTNTGILAESGKFQIVAGGPESQVSVSVIGGTSTVLIGKPTAANAKPTALAVSVTSKGTAAATGTGTEAGATGTGVGSGSSGASGAALDASGVQTTGTATGLGTSSGPATYGSRGFAIALGMIGVGFATMFVVA